MMGRIRALPFQRHMQRHEVRGREDLLEGAVSGISAFARARRIVPQHAEADGAGARLDASPHIAVTDDAEGLAGETESPAPREGEQGGEQPFGDAVGVASRGGDPANSRALEPARVEMVVADRCRADEFHPAARQKRGVDSNAGAHGERVGVREVGSGDRKIPTEHGFAQRGERLPRAGQVVGANDSRHGDSKLATARRGAQRDADPSDLHVRRARTPSPRRSRRAGSEIARPPSSRPTVDEEDSSPTMGLPRGSGMPRP